MKVFAVIGIFAIGCHAACFNATRMDGDTEMSSSCVDDVTGQEFQYIDLDNVLELDGTSTDDMATRMYTAYLSGAGDATTTATSDGDGNLKLAKRAKIYWNECVPDRVAGACSDNHVPTWNAGLDSFESSLKSIFAPTQRNNRADKSPRSVCTKFSAGTICVSWAAYYSNRLQTAQINDIVHDCTYQCEQEYRSCLARARTGSKLEYYCVSNRATGCKADTSIRDCS